MPELPEAYTIACDLHGRLVGLRIERVCVVRGDVIRRGRSYIHNDLPGRVVRDVRAYGKIVCIGLDGGRWIVVRLGMTGQLYTAAASDPLAPHTHLVLTFHGSDDSLRFRDVRRFGGVLLERGASPDRLPTCRDLGPDAMTIDRAAFVARVRRSRSRIKPLLLNQKAVAGLGNIYVDESLHAARIHPLARACDLSKRKVGTLFDAMRAVLTHAIECGGSSISDHRRGDGTLGYFQIHHQVYGKTDRPCPRCGRPIERLVVGGRSTHVCGGCQRV